MATTNKRSEMFTRLRRAIENVKFLLSFNATRWIFSSILGSPSPRRHRRFSFRRQPSGLLDCADDECYYEAGSSFVLSRSTSTDTSRSTSPASDITRSTSDASSPTSSDDIDKRAEDFIQNFYRHIQMERQVSLELRYSGGKVLERTQSD